MTYYIICLSVFVLAYTLNLTYISVFYHRWSTHGAVELHPLLRRFVVATGSWVTGIDLKGWTCMHRMHHLYSDTEMDPHSPRRFGIFGLMLGQLRSYQAILRGLLKNDPKYAEIVKDLGFPVHWLNQKKLWILPYALHFAIWMILGFGFGYWLPGYAYFAGMMSHPIQGWMVNAFGHSSGYRNYNVGDDSRNNTIVAWLVFGEGYQNNHHRFPKSAKFSMRWFEVDLGYQLVLLLSGLGALKIMNIASDAESKQQVSSMQSAPIW